MLGKLMKYDMKALNKFLIIIHGFLLLSAVLVRIFLTSRITMDNGDSITLFSLIFLLYTLIIVGASYGTLIVIAVRFYKNLFSDEGYLTHTLPVTSSQHLLSKTITGSIWSLIDSVLIFLSMYIVAVTPEVKHFFFQNQKEFLMDMGLTAETFPSAMQTLGFALVIIMIISAFANVITLYASVTLGQLFSGHRVLGAVVAYFVITTILSVITFAVMSLLGYSAFSSSVMPADIDFMSFMTKTLWISAALETISTVILYIAAHYIMKKRINLI